MDEDNLIRNTTDERHAAEAVRILSRARSQAEIIARCKWVETQDEQAVTNEKQTSPRGGHVDGLGEVNGNYLSFDVFLP